MIRGVARKAHEKGERGARKTWERGFYGPAPRKKTTGCKGDIRTGETGLKIADSKGVLFLNLGMLSGISGLGEKWNQGKRTRGRKRRNPNHPYQ